MNILYYRGKPVDTLTRDELIEALTGAVQEIKRLHSQHQKDLDFTKELSLWRKVLTHDEQTNRNRRHY